MTWTNQAKNEIGATRRFLAIGDGFLLNIGNNNNLIIQDGTAGWSHQTKTSSSWSNITKN